MERKEDSTGSGAEWILMFVFFMIWLLIIFDKTDEVMKTIYSIKEKIPVDMTIWDEAGENLIKNARGEIIPLLSYEKYLEEDSLFLPLLRTALSGEIFPIQGYSTDYWKDNGNVENQYSDFVPDYFRESDEGNVEDKKEDAGRMEETASGKSYTLDELSDNEFLREKFYIIDSSTSVTKKELDGKKLAEMDLSGNYTGTEPKVLIYHTHGSETYKKEKGKNGSVIEVGKELKKQLEEKYGIAAIHDTTVYDQVNGELDRSAAYNYAGESVASALKKNPSVQIVIDLHRDSVDDSINLVTEIKGKKTAQIMFFNGVSRLAGSGDIEYLYNPNKTANLAFSLQMQLLAARYYPDFTRKIYIKGYRYNLHLAKRAMLVEVGAQNNTLTEAKNAMEPLSELLYRLLGGEKAYVSAE
ncbi:MAG: stage II sporulation protein P [Eubacterium sp.]|nr:stage II sporulation protein P [Eubacterium sp.]